VRVGARMEQITETVAARVGDPQRTRSWRIATALALLATGTFAVAVVWLFVAGVGIWAVNSPVGWGVAIASFVWWIGIGHAGTLISAVLLLCRQPWRDSINRMAEAMTLVAILCAGIYPILHLGRPQFFYWLVPYPAVSGYWPQFRSPLVWDLFAIATYGLVSLVFWYLGLVPDLATMRDRAQGWRARAWGVFALGWRGSSRQWTHHRRCYLLLAGLATPLVVSVHTVVSFDFAVTQLPGWHSTVFPIYFVAGALYSGLAMVLTLVIPVRAWFGLRELIDDGQLERLAKLMLAAGLFTSYGYFAELFFAWYAGEPSHLAQIREHLVGEFAPLYWTVIALNVGVLQLLWSRRVRQTPLALVAISILVNLGMWLERYLIVITSLERDDFMPSSWAGYTASVWDWLTLFGSFGVFALAMLLLLRYLPMISMAEVRERALASREEGDDG